MKLLPSLDLRGGRCVRLLRGDFAAETAYDVEPRTLVRHYAALGAAWVHIVDLDGARDGALAHRDLLAELVVHGGVALQVGGGVRSEAVGRELLSLGVARIVIGSAAVENPDAVLHWAASWGPERVCLALDVRLDDSGLPRILTRGWQVETPAVLWDVVERYSLAGVRHVLCTDVARDGALEGPNLDLYRQAVDRHPNIAWQASGGVRDANDLQALAATGVDSAISGKALLESRIDAEAMRRWLQG